MFGLVVVAADRSFRVGEQKIKQTTTIFITSSSVTIIARITVKFGTYVTRTVALF